MRQIIFGLVLLGLSVANGIASLEGTSRYPEFSLAVCILGATEAGWFWGIAYQRWHHKQLYKYE